MSDTSILPEDHAPFNCPACGGEETVPSSSLFRWELENPIRPKRVLIMGTCDCCHSTRVQWRETPQGDRLPE